MLNLFRSSDGSTLVISSSDGYCSTLSFEPGELGNVYTGEMPKNATSAGPTPSSNQATPAPTPTSFAPPSPFTGPAHQHRNSAGSFAAPSPPTTASFVSLRPSSPARSNSTSSIATQASAAVLTNPPLIGGSVPGIAATNSGKVTGVPISTPPETPRPSGSTGISTSTTTAGVKRDASEGEKDQDDVSAGGPPKKRRIAPTPVTDAR